MKTIRINQNQLGSFYLGDPERQHSFSMSIVEDGNTIVVDGKKAVAQFIIPEADHNESILHSDKFTNLSDNFEEILHLCSERSLKVISSHDYKGEFFAFLKAYKEHFEEIEKNILEERKKDLQKKLKEIQSLLSMEELIPDPENVLNYIRPIKDRIKSINHLVSSYSKERDEFKEESESFKKRSGQIQNLQDEKKLIEDLLSSRNEE